ncbi:MAG TPA: hypothetical protein VFD92_05390 [Candidatus Binatia bacterium]|nr:hypothetical protein [Candidatus Binatia bacterium]
MTDRAALARRLYVLLDEFAGGVERFFVEGGRHEAWRSSAGAGDFHIASVWRARTLLFGFYGLVSIEEGGKTKDVALGMPAFQVELAHDGTADLDTLCFSHEPSGKRVSGPDLGDEVIGALLALLSAMNEDKRAGRIELVQAWQPATRVADRNAR